MAESERSIGSALGYDTLQVGIDRNWEEFPNVPQPDSVTSLVNASSAWPLRWPAESEGCSEPYTVLIENQLQQVP